MKNKIESPKISIQLLEPQEVYSLESREEICNKSIEDLTIDNQEANRVSFDKVLFKNVIYPILISRVPLYIVRNSEIANS